jgi:hypothetical protein
VFANHQPRDIYDRRTVYDDIHGAPVEYDNIYAYLEHDGTLVVYNDDECDDHSLVDDDRRAALVKLRTAINRELDDVDHDTANLHDRHPDYDGPRSAGDQMTARDDYPMLAILVGGVGTACAEAEKALDEIDRLRRMTTLPDPNKPCTK